MSTEFYVGKDYPSLCDPCKTAVDDAAMLLGEGVGGDTDDPEAPLMFAGDHGWFCAGRGTYCSHPK